MPLSKELLSNVISNCKYKDYDIVLRFDDDRPYLQVQFMAEDCITKKPERQYCRKWMLSYHMCLSEVVRTAFKAVLAAEQHEVEELFKYAGEAVYRPHLDVRELHNLSRENKVDKRE